MSYIAGIKREDFTSHCYSKRGAKDLSIPSQKRKPVLKKDFKITGQFRKSLQKDRLNQSSLADQIANGVPKGTTETERMETVIRAVCPGLSFRS